MYESYSGKKVGDPYPAKPDELVALKWFKENESNKSLKFDKKQTNRDLTTNNLDIHYWIKQVNSVLLNN